MLIIKVMVCVINVQQAVLLVRQLLIAHHAHLDIIWLEYCVKSAMLDVPHALALATVQNVLVDIN
jgi:hypothetical protein